MKEKYTTGQKIAVAVLDLLLLMELTFSIYLCHGHSDGMTLVFLKTYIPLALVTVVAGLIVIRRLGSRTIATGEAA
ncbi:MAG: hypothetical protein GX422_15735 [Deltaproteobacteria bacterium]|jgi:hypothetical protein|nr:hypothetical protein [Deltaproteobacteria bacterium]